MPGAAPEIGSVPFTEAIDFFRQKGNLRLPTKHWTDLKDGMHSRAFVVAGATSDALLGDMFNELLKLQVNGGILDDFRKSFDDIVARHGWRHKGSAGFRSKVIFQTNMRTAAAAGKWAQIQRLKDRRPYLRYVAVMDKRTRQLHRDWHGTVLHADDPWWEVHFPPCGWNCRCSVQQLSERDLKRFGYTISPQAPRSLLQPKIVDTPTGPIVVPTPEGIDPGFAYNPGIAAGQGEQLLAAERHGGWKPLDGFVPTDTAALPPLKPSPTDLPLLPRASSPADVAGMLEAVLGGPEKVFVDPAGAHVRVGAALSQHLAEEAHREGRERYFNYLPSLIEDPAEIWVGFARSEETGRVWIRRRYVKVIQLDKGKPLMILVDFDGRTYSALTFFEGEMKALRRPAWRGGVLAYRDPGQIGP